MTITGVRLYSYRLPLVAPLLFLNTPIEFRDGFLLQIEDSVGNLGYGECAPLPGYSRETIEQSELQLRRLAMHLKYAEIDTPLDSADALFESDTSSSVRFAVESALITLAASQRAQPVAAMFNEDFALEVPVNALLESSEILPSRVEQLAGQNCRAVKVKVGRQEIDKDIELVRLVREHLSTEVTLRLDANRHWTFDQAIRFAEGIAGCDIEYIEEPLRDPSELPQLAQSCPGLLIALDESTRDIEVDEIHMEDYFRAVVIKPTVVGGIARSFEIIRACKQSGKRAVLGAAIESSVGLTMIANMASSLLDDIPIGLDTGRLFARDLIEPPLRISDYHVEINSSGPSNLSLNSDLMREVPLG